MGYFKLSDKGHRHLVKIDRGTWAFLKIDRGTWVFLKIDRGTWAFLKIDMGHGGPPIQGPWNVPFRLG